MKQGGEGRGFPRPSFGSGEAASKIRKFLYNRRKPRKDFSKGGGKSFAKITVEFEGIFPGGVQKIGLRQGRRREPLPEVPMCRDRAAADSA